LYLTLFGIYRILSADVNPKLNTITDSFTGDRPFVLVASEWMKRNSSAFLGGPIPLDSIQVKKFRFLETSSPTSSVSWRGMVTDIQALSQHPIVFSALMKYLERTNSGYIRSFIIDIRNVLSYLTKLSISKEIGSSEESKRYFLFNVKTSIPSGTLGQLLPIGQLSFKKEAAGKLRVFAMVDGWTQSILAPLHDTLFARLKSLPNDGTFDQNAAFGRARVKAAQYGVVYGYDLSAATDRLPVILQQSILDSLLGPEMGLIWSTILVARPYVVPPNRFGLVEESLKYTVGQPMGALTSFAMLGITHHMVMQ
jgi:hypothetical protein